MVRIMVHSNRWHSVAFQFYLKRIPKESFVRTNYRKLTPKIDEQKLVNLKNMHSARFFIKLLTCTLFMQRDLKDKVQRANRGGTAAISY